MTPVRTIGWLIIAILMTVIFSGIGIWQAHTYYTGETVTAHVDRCETHYVHSRHGGHNETDCYGSWTTSDGRQHDGEIPGAGESDEGSDVKLRALGDTVVSDSALGALWPLGVAGLGLVLTVAAAFAVRTARRRVAGGTVPGGFRPGGRGPTRYGPPPPPPGAPAYGQPQYGQPAYGPPAYGHPAPGQPAYGQPQYGPPAYPAQPGPPAPPPGYPPAGSAQYPPPGYGGRPPQQGGYPPAGR